jgi:predicted DNA-binding transcriptional regulator
MTITESDLLSFIRENTDELPRRAKGQGIIVKELADAEGASKDWANKRLSNLYRRGLMKRTLMTWRDSEDHAATGYVYEKVV